MFDCIEKHNRIYICGVANLLPRELQGHPNDVSHAVIHDLIMTEGVKQASSRTMRLTNAIAKITIDLQGRSGKQSIHAAWINLSKLEEKFEATVDPKILIKWLLKNLRPKQTKLVIESLQNAGTAREKETRTNVFAFHEMLMDIADTNRKAIDYGLTAPADSRPQGRALVVSTGTVVRPKHLDTRISHGLSKPTKKTKAAIAENGCKHHGKGSWHGTSECFIENPQLAPEGYDRKAAVENLKRRKEFWDTRKSQKAKAKLAKIPNDGNISDSTLEEVRGRGAFTFVTGRAYSASAQSSSGDPYEFLSANEESESEDSSSKSEDNCSTSVGHEGSESITSSSCTDFSVGLHAFCTPTPMLVSQLVAENSFPSDQLHFAQTAAENRQKPTSGAVTGETAGETFDASAGETANTSAGETEDETTGNRSREPVYSWQAHASSVHATNMCADNNSSSMPASTDLMCVEDLQVPNCVCPSVYRCYWLEPQWVWDNTSARWKQITGRHSDFYAYDSGKKYSYRLLPGQCVSVADQAPRDLPTMDTIRHIRGARASWINSAMGKPQRKGGRLTVEEARIRNGRVTNHFAPLTFLLWALQQSEFTMSTGFPAQPMNAVHVQLLTLQYLVGRPIGTSPIVPEPLYSQDESSSEPDDELGDWPNVHQPHTDLSDDSSETDDNDTHHDDDSSNVRPASNHDGGDYNYNDDTPRTLKNDKTCDFDDDCLQAHERRHYIDQAYAVLQRLNLVNNLNSKPPFENPKGAVPMPNLFVPNLNKLTCPCTLGMKSRGPLSLRKYCWPNRSSAVAFAAGGWAQGSIWDSGASNHLCNTPAAVKDQKPARVGHITDIAGNESAVTGLGTMGDLTNVLVVPTATETLVSVGSFLDQSQGCLKFTAHAVSYRGPNQRNYKPVGRRREDGLYLAFRLRAPAAPKACLGKQQIQFQLLRERVHALHRCFGHASKARMKTILKNYNIAGIRPHHVSLLTSCDSCSVGKSKKSKAPKSSKSKARIFGTRLLSDNSGLLRVESMSGKRCANVTIDEATSWIWASPLRSPMDTYQLIKEILEVELHQRHEHCVQYFRSDAGTEMCNAEMDALLRHHGIKRELTCTETSYQNGKAERYIGVLFGMLRTFLHESRLPQQYWAEGLCTAAYVHNRLPLTTNPEGHSPFQLRHGKPPDLSFLRPFGSGCSIVLPKRHHRGKHLPKARHGVMVGYGYVRGQKGYRVFVPSMHKVLTSVNVTFSDMYQSIRARQRDHPHLHSTSAEVEQMLVDFDVFNLLPVSIEGSKDSDNGTRPVPTIETETNVEIENDYSSSRDERIMEFDTTRNRNHHDNSDFEASKQEDSSKTDDDNDKQPSTDGENDFVLDDGNQEADCNNYIETNGDDAPVFKDEYSMDEADLTAQEGTTGHSPNGELLRFSKLRPDPAQVQPILKQATGWVNIPSDHPYLKRDELGRPLVTDLATGTSIAERVRSRKALTSACTHVTDCIPNFVAHVATASPDLASDHKTPKHFGEAMRSSDKEHWLKAIADELKAVRAMNCYDLLVSQSLLPKGANLIGFTWVFRIKIHEDGTVARFKARICVDGSRQIYGLDFEETFAPVANAATIRLVLAVAVHNDMTLRQFDIKLAFVSANIDRPVYMRSPTGSGEPLGSVWKLKRSLYGLRQAPRLFNAKLHATLCAFGWKQSKHDPCLYILRKGKHFSFLVAVVDDLLLATTNSSVCKTFYSNMSRVFDFKDMGAPCYMIGMHLRRSGPKLRISQQQYIRDIAHRHSSLLLNCHPATTPAVASFKMVKTGLYRSDPSPLVDSKLYRSLIC